MMGRAELRDAWRTLGAVGLGALLGVSAFVAADRLTTPTTDAQRALIESVVEDPQPGRASLAFATCAEARAADAAPVHIGQPGYGAHLDRDRDGVGCEPYHGP
jgi:hypothetical protein